MAYFYDLRNDKSNLMSHQITSYLPKLLQRKEKKSEVGSLFKLNEHFFHLLFNSLHLFLTYFAKTFFETFSPPLLNQILTKTVLISCTTERPDSQQRLQDFQTHFQVFSLITLPLRQKGLQGRDWSAAYSARSCHSLSTLNTWMSRRRGSHKLLPSSHSTPPSSARGLFS